MKTEYTLDHFHITRYKLGSLCTKFKGNRRISAYVYKLGTYLGLCAYFIPKAYNICQVTNCGPVQLKTKYILDLFTLLGTNLDLFTYIMKKNLRILAKSWKLWTLSFENKVNSGPFAHSQFKFGPLSTQYEDNCRILAKHNKYWTFKLKNAWNLGSFIAWMDISLNVFARQIM